MFILDTTLEVITITQRHVRSRFSRKARAYTYVCFACFRTVDIIFERLLDEYLCERSTRKYFITRKISHRVERNVRTDVDFDDVDVKKTQKNERLLQTRVVPSKMSTRSKAQSLFFFSCVILVDDFLYTINTVLRAHRKIYTNNIFKRLVLKCFSIRLVQIPLNSRMNRKMIVMLRNWFVKKKKTSPLRKQPDEIIVRINERSGRFSDTTTRPRRR